MNEMTESKEIQEFCKRIIGLEIKIEELKKSLQEAVKGGGFLIAGPNDFYHANPIVVTPDMAAPHFELALFKASSELALHKSKLEKMYEILKS